MSRDHRRSNVECGRSMDDGHPSDEFHVCECHNHTSIEGDGPSVNRIRILFRPTCTCRALSAAPEAWPLLVFQRFQLLTCGACAAAYTSVSIRLVTIQLISKDARRIIAARYCTCSCKEGGTYLESVHGGSVDTRCRTGVEARLAMPFLPHGW